MIRPWHVALAGTVLALPVLIWQHAPDLAQWLAARSEAQPPPPVASVQWDKIAPPLEPAAWGQPTGLYRFEDPLRQVTIYLYRDPHGVAMYGFRWEGDQR